MIVVVGAMSSGNRLMRDVLMAGGLHAVVDTSHGTRDLDVGGDIVIMRRIRCAAEASRRHNWAGKPEEVTWEASMAGIRARYHGAPQVWYRDLCDDTDRVIARLAALYGVEPWEPPYPIVNQNPRWVAARLG